MADALASILGFCGICIYTALDRPFGADARCCGPRGCCGSCCDRSFNEDGFDERMKKEQAKSGANAEPVDSQPAPSQSMSATNGPEPGDEEVH